MSYEEEDACHMVARKDEIEKETDFSSEWRGRQG
jgi:hypothetical protein